MQELFKKLRDKIPGAVSFKRNLAELTYWKIGGNADCLVEPNSIDELAEAIKFTSHYPNIPRLIIGDCSNLLFDDNGFPGVLIKLGNSLNKINFEGSDIYCEAGAWVPEVAYRAYRKGLSGIEHTCGIPGRLGGLIYMNGGSQRRGILENVKAVLLIDEDGNKDWVRAAEIEHSYRHSPFQDQKKIIAAAVLTLQEKTRKNVCHDMRTILASRRKKFPRKLPNCGSVFLSNPNMYDKIGPPGFAIEKVGLKGVKFGQAQISPLHANFIVNLGNASSSDVLYLINLARKTVHDETGFYMDCEVRYVKPNGDIIQAHIAADELYNDK